MTTHTPAQLAQYCVDHHYTLTTQTSHWSFYMPYWTILTYVAAIAVGYTVARVGIPALYSDIKSLFTRTTMTTVTVPAPATSTTVISPVA